MERDPAYIQDILHAARLAVSYAEGVSRDDFLKNNLLQDSVIRRIEIIGESARRVSSGTKTAQPHIPWDEMIGMRNFMIHEYDSVDMGVVWDTVQRDIRILSRFLNRLLHRRKIDRGALLRFFFAGATSPFSPPSKEGKENFHLSICPPY